MLKEMLGGLEMGRRRGTEDTSQPTLGNTLIVQGGILLDIIGRNHQRVSFVACYSSYLGW